MPEASFWQAAKETLINSEFSQAMDGLRADQ